MWARAAAMLSAATLLAYGCVSAGGPSGTLSPVLGPVDLLVFAPHPDDEVIGAGGVLQQALAAGRRVRIVFATNGDAYPQAASALFNKPVSALQAADYLRLAATRQGEAVAANRTLGVGPSSLVFLGYPDGILAGVYADAGDVPVQSPTTGRTETYGAVETDFHTLAHGHPAPYTRAAALADVVEVMRESQPALVYVTDRADQHPDHLATYELVHDAIAKTGFKGELLTYVVHSGLTQQWPWPQGQTPGSPFETHTVGGTTFPIGVPWPPPVRVTLTAGQSALKLQALEAYRSQWAIDQEYLGSFVKSEEIFWTGR
jgi:LmbE family N-acetylglucosaminyl deacetylase